MDKIVTGVHLLLNAINAWTPEQWFLIGSFFASVAATIGFTAWVKRRHLRKYAEKLRSEFIVLNVGLAGFVLAVTDFVLVNGAQLAGLAPFLQKYWPSISFAAITTHAVATAVMKHFKDNKVGTTLANDTPAVTTPVTVTETTPVISTPRTTNQPVSSDLFTS